MKKLFNIRNRILVFAYDVCMIPVAWLGAYWLRFDDIPEWALTQAIDVVGLVIFAQTTAFVGMGFYRSLWRFASLHDVVKIGKSIFLGCGLILLALFASKQLEGLPRSIIPNYAILLAMGLGGARISIRFIREYQKQLRTHHKTRVLIVGAGEAGEGLVRDMLRSTHHSFKPVAFIDDKSSKQGAEIHGIRVVGRTEDIAKVIARYGVEHIVLAMPSAPSSRICALLKVCEATHLPISTLPALQHIVSGQVGVELLREISLDDLLGREPFSLDWEGIRSLIMNKVVLVSGAGGSIGSEVCRQIAGLQPKALIAVEISEFNLFTLEQELHKRFPALQLHIHLMDVRDRVGVGEILSRHRPDLVFHAAAYKHVPMLESQLRAAVYNNVIGTRRLAEAAVQHRVEKFVLVSTDKAVNPENIMGATKRIAEMICQNLHDQHVHTQFITVRFGNVLGSAGSVVPIFKQQIESGGPVTVTHPEITRFFMSIPEAAQLILQSVALGKAGEILVLDMGEPIKIQFLAEQMIRLSGREDIQIEYTGLRPGEKLFEELFHQHERLEATHHHKILRARSRSFDRDLLEQAIQGFEKACHGGNEAELKVLIAKLVPELRRGQKELLQTINVTGSLDAVPVMKSEIYPL